MNISIPKEALATLPAARYEGHIRLIETAEDADFATAELSKSDIIGFDTETRPAFKKGQSHLVALLQLSTRDTCYLFRLNKIGMPASVRSLLENPDIKKIGLSIHDDFLNLRKTTELEPAGFVELQQYVKKWNITDASLTKLYGILFGQRLSKAQRLSNWEADELSASQQAYAALDAKACIDIYEYLESGRFNPAESPYLVAESDNPTINP